MEDLQITELMLSAGDHRVLFACTETWRMVQDNVFAPFEHFLIDGSRELFLLRLNRKERVWFVLFFLCTPEKPYHACLLPAPEDGQMRLVMAEPGQIMPNHLHCLSRMSTLEAVLSLSGNLFFEYCSGMSSIIPVSVSFSTSLPAMTCSGKPEVG